MSHNGIASVKLKELIDRHTQSEHIAGTTSPSTENFVWWRLTLLVLGMELALRHFSHAKNTQESPRFGQSI